VIVFCSAAFMITVIFQSAQVMLDLFDVIIISMLVLPLVPRFLFATVFVEVLFIQALLMFFNSVTAFLNSAACRAVAFAICGRV
jgi:hypothetical protein